MRTQAQPRLERYAKKQDSKAWECISKATAIFSSPSKDLPKLPEALIPITMWVSQSDFGRLPACVCFPGAVSAEQDTQRLATSQH